MKQCDILIRNVSVLTPQYEIHCGQYVAIDNQKIVSIGKDTACQYVADTVIPGEGKLAMPGLVDSHVHVCQCLLRGKLADEYPMVWSRILVPFESALTEEECFVSGQLTYLQQIKSGITTNVEAGGNHMHAVAEAALQSGIRAVLTRSTMDQGAFIPPSWKETTNECLDRTDELHQHYHGAGEGRIQVWYAMRQIMSCSPALLEGIAARASELGVGVHAHLAEHKDEVSYCLQNFHKRPAEVLDPANIKVVFDREKRALYLSRTPIPYPYGSLDCTYYKHVGIIGYSRDMLDFYQNSVPGPLELAEGIDTLRFLDYGKPLYLIQADKGESLSVDTLKDLEEVRKRSKNHYFARKNY